MRIILSLIIFALGFFQILLMRYFPKENVELGVFVIIFVNILASSLISIVYFNVFSKKKKYLYFTIAVIVMILISNYSFPSFPKSSPVVELYKACNTYSNYNNISFNNLLDDSYKINKPLFIAAKHKFEKTIPDKIFTVNYLKNKGSEYTSLKRYNIYFKDSMIFTNNPNLNFNPIVKDTMIFNEKYGATDITILGLKHSDGLGIDLNGFYPKNKGYLIWIEENTIDGDCNLYRDFKRLIIKK